MVKECYRCEVCSQIYDEEIYANKCEASHRFIKNHIVQIYDREWDLNERSWESFKIIKDELNIIEYKITYDGEIHIGNELQIDGVNIILDGQRMVDSPSKIEVKYTLGRFAKYIHNHRI